MMDSNNWTSFFNKSDCDLAYQMAHSPLIVAIRVVHIVACSIGLIACTTFMLILTRRTISLHINVRILLISLALAAMISCTVLLLVAVYGLVLTFSVVDSCRLLQSKWLCSLLRAPSSAAVYAMIIGNFIVAIERSIATVQYRTYEIQGSIRVGVVLVIIQWLIALMVGLFERGVHEIVGFVHYCTAYVSDPSSASPKLSGMVALELIALITYVCLLFANKKKMSRFANRAMHTLTERYQLQENIRVIQTIIPSVIVHATIAFFSLLAFLGYAFFSPDLDGTIRNFAPYSEIVLLSLPAFATTFPLVTVMRNRRLRMTAEKIVPCLFGRKKLNNNYTTQSSITTVRHAELRAQESEQYFIMLNNMWQ